MTIVSRVCAEFCDRSGKTLLVIRPQDLLTIMDAPEEIREDPLFDMLIADGSLEAVRSVEQQKSLESDPVAGTTAEGKKTKPRKSGTAESAKVADSKTSDDLPVGDSPSETADPAEPVK